MIFPSDRLRKFYCDHALGLQQRATGVIVAEVAGAQPLEPRKLVLSPEGMAPVGVRINGEDYADREDFAGQESAHDVAYLLPLLRAGDVLEVLVEWQGAGPAPMAAGALIAGFWGEGSYVGSYELPFDSERLIEPGEALEMRAHPERSMRADRLYIAGGRREAQHFAVEQIFIGTHMSIMGDAAPAAAFLAPHLRDVALKVMNAQVPVVLRVRNLGETPRRFQGKLIGAALA